MRSLARLFRSITPLALSLLLFLSARRARADIPGPLPPPEPPAGTDEQKPASTGATDVEKPGFASSDVLASDEDAEATRVTDVTFSAGGLFTEGNARTVAVTAANKTRVRRDDHQFSAAAAANYARGGAPNAPIETTVENLQGLLRYDYYFVSGWSLFAQVSGRHDRFQGLALRSNFDPGVARYFIDVKRHRFWIEAGYDLQYDIRTQQAIDDAAHPADPTKTAPILLDRTHATQGGRAFVGYENKVNARVAFNATVEYLQSFERAEAARLNVDLGIHSQIAKKLSVATTLSVRYDNAPLPGVLTTDSIASVSFVYAPFALDK